MKVAIQSPYVDNNGYLTMHSQDLFIIRDHGRTATLVEYENYINREEDKRRGAKLDEDEEKNTQQDKLNIKPALIEWCYDESNYHFFFKTKNGFHPMNMTGPVLTKVLPWNLKKKNTHYPEGFPENVQLEPGYILDLRILQLNRLFSPAEESTENKPPLEFIRDTEITGLKDLFPDSRVKHGIEFPPVSITNQAIAPIEENLYIISYVNPLRARDNHSFYPYHIHYISAEQLDQLSSGSAEFDLLADRDLELDDLHINTTEGIHEIIREKGRKEVVKRMNRAAAQVLARYFRDTGVQVGAINPKDINVEVPKQNKLQSESVDSSRLDAKEKNDGTICMVANLRSFL
ncbi:hypothetical protein [Vibrio quintilis]|uniref:Uncharacterized protein n=1 Tax=Vibrio quintilis TaxID=1117707 RepID=A0A1M7Z2A2_9VIBR|nr:hypothetical protein [Vibrio quintilis]SHO58925.1 hypothetical protein VQ7734_04700 [Vibrio quintilis]